MSNNQEKEQAKDFSSLFQELREDTTAYAEHRLQYFKLYLLERLSKSSSLLALGLIIAFLAFSAFCFALIALAFLLGELLGSNAQGFGVVALFWLVLLIIIILLREPIKSYFLNRTVRLLYKIDKEDSEENGEQQQQQ